MRKLLLKLSVFILISFNQAEAISNQYDKELSELQSVIGGKLENVFLVRLFNGYFSIPIRYVLVSEPSAYEKKLEFNSPSTYIYNKDLNISKTNDTIGSITIGLYENYLEEQVSKKRTSMYLADKFNKYGLKVFVFKRKGDNINDELSFVLIHDNVEYITIFDENPKLWKTMLLVHERLREKNKFKENKRGR